MRIGVDLGGTKTEGVLLGDDGDVQLRLRRPTPKRYCDVLATVAAIVGELQQQSQPRATIGICTPGALSPRTNLLKNSNSVCLNGKPLLDDLRRTLDARVRIANDADCLAVSEATDGAAAGADVVFAVILGTGVGGGVALRARVHRGNNAVGGEWGHNPLPWMQPAESPGRECYCGKRGCIETFLSGPGMQRDHREQSGESLTAPDIERRAAQGDPACAATLARYEQRLARGLTAVVNVLDPDVIVLGGGLSNMQRLYDNLPRLMLPMVFGGDFATPIRRAQHGDSSGVRGAAWLWSA